MNYDLMRGLHIIAVIAWMAGIMYLPRLFAYHTDAPAGSEMDKTFQTMELKLYRIIMGPAMVLALVFGLALMWIDATQIRGGWGYLAKPWMIAKLAGWSSSSVGTTSSGRPARSSWPEPIPAAQNSGVRPMNCPSSPPSSWSWP